MDTHTNRIRQSNVPVFVRLREYLRLSDDNKIVDLEGASFLVVDEVLRPVRIQSARYY